MSLPTPDPRPHEERDSFIPDPTVNADGTTRSPESSEIATGELANGDPRLEAASTRRRSEGHSEGRSEGQPESDVLPEPAALLLAQLQEDQSAERRRFRILLVLAALAHVALFFVVFPDFTREPEFTGTPGEVYVLQQTPFKKKPPPRAEKQEEKKIPKKKAKKIPIPDPTPDDPEPIEVEEIDVLEIELAEVADVVFGIPDGPDPGTGKSYGVPFDGDALQVGNGIAKPVAISKPQPNYTEKARQARIQGVVILSCVVTENGDVAKLKVIKGLPLGLDESALETVATWKFKPARDAQGRPVAVQFLVNVNFWLQ